MTTTLNDHKHKWRETESSTTMKPTIKQETCNCGDLKITYAEGKAYYFGGLLGHYGPKPDTTASTK